MSTEQMVERIRRMKPHLEKEYGVLQIGIFGSYARNEQTDESDIDIAVEIKSAKKTLHSFLALKRALESELGRSVDLGIESTLKKAVYEQVKREMVYV